MRVDVFLNRVCILKSRTLAREACDRGKVLLNGKTAKGKEAVAEGDSIHLDLVIRKLELEIIAVPPGRVSKKAALEYYRVIKDEKVDVHEG